MTCQRCGFTYCPICRLDTQTVHVTVRGLCPDSMYNSAYTLTMTGAGSLRFLGHHTSSIQFDLEHRLWRWLDMKDGRSVATRTVKLLV